MTYARPSRLLALTTGALLAASAALGTAIPAAAAVPSVTVTYDYTGAPQTFQVPTGVTSVTVVADGGYGSQSYYDETTSSGGRGASVSATVPVRGGSTLAVVVAGDASAAGNTCGASYAFSCGGYGASAGGNARFGGGGGGASAVRDDGGTTLVLAAGGGGAGTGGRCGYSIRSTPGNGGDAGAAGMQGGRCTAGGNDVSGSQGGGPGTASGGGTGGSAGDGTVCSDGGLDTGDPGVSATGPGGARGNAGGAGGGGFYGGGSGGDGSTGRGCPDTLYTSGSGGGGGGSSYVTPSASGVTVGLSTRAFQANGRVSITYTPVVTGITLTPASSSIAAGGSQTYAVTATTANGSADVTDESTLSIAPSSGGSATGASCTGNACTAQTVGTYTVTATRGSLTSNPSILTVTPGTPAFVIATSGSGQSATAGTAFANPLVATVTDAYGNPVSGATVTFAIDPSSTSTATLSNGGQATTGSNGQASVTLTAGSTAGPLTVTATSGTGSAAFLETVTPAGPARADLTVSLDGPTSVRNGSSATLTITVKNTGPNASGKYAAAIALPRQLTPTASSTGGKRYGSVVVFRGTDLAPGATASYQVTVTARGKGTVGYLGAAMGTTTDPKPGNNVAVRSISIT